MTTTEKWHGEIRFRSREAYVCDAKTLDAAQAVLDSEISKSYGDVLDARIWTTAGTGPGDDNRRPGSWSEFHIRYCRQHDEWYSHDRQREWHIYDTNHPKFRHVGPLLNTMFFNTDMNANEVYAALVADGFDPDIEVEPEAIVARGGYNKRVPGENFSSRVVYQKTGSDQPARSSYVPAVADVLRVMREQNCSQDSAVRFLGGTP